jgi:hypothetical protein
VPRARSARGVCGVDRQRIGKNLDRDVTTELLIARAVDLSHASGTQHRQNFVAAKASSIGEMRGSTHCAAIIGRRLERMDSFRGRRIEGRSALKEFGLFGLPVRMVD